MGLGGFFHVLNRVPGMISKTVMKPCEYYEGNVAQIHI
jgi:hypothetical protein